MADEPSANPDEIRSQTRRLRRLARGLLYDRDRAEDVVQEAWLAALRQVPRRDGSLRAWLAGTVKRLAMNANRGDVRRQQREEACAQGERLPSTVDTAGRIESLRSLVDAVEALEEPYRETIVLRFFDELAPREVARRQGLPVETVRTRTKRGLAQLRQRLDERHADARGSFLAALVPLAGEMPWSIAVGVPSGSSFTGHLVGGLVMTKPLQLALAALAIALLSNLGYRALVVGERPLVTPPPPDPGAAAFAPKVETELPEARAQEAERSIVAPPVASIAGDWIVRGCLTRGIDEPYPGGTIRAQVFEWSAGEDVALLHEERLTCDEHGEFSWALPTPTSAVTVRVTAEMVGHFEVADQETVPRGDDPPHSLFPRAFPIDRTLVGRVVDSKGDPVAGARVANYHVDTETGTDGRFTLPDSSVHRRIHGRILASGLAEAEFSRPNLGRNPIDVGDVVLARGLEVSGQVVDETGRPVEGAEVRRSWRGYGSPREDPLSLTDAVGRFRLDSLEPADRLTLCANKDGFVQTSAEFDPEAGPVAIILKRGGVVRGRVSMADGSSSEGVWLCVGFHPNGVPRVDGYADTDGRFELSSVPAGIQTLWAIRKGKVTTSVEIDVPEGGGVLGGIELEIQNGQWLEGIVLDEDGEPFPWVAVYVDGRSAGRYSGRRDVYVPSARSTDREGRFRIEGLPGGKPLTIGFLHHGYSRQEEVLEAFDRDDLVVRMQPSGRLAGRVVDGATGKPVDAFTVRFTHTQVPGEEALEGYWAKWGQPGQAFANTDGYWNADNEQLNAGGWTDVEVTAEGFGPTLLHVQARVEPEVLEYRLYPGAVVRGRVVEAATGLPVEGATVKRFMPSGMLQYPSADEKHPYSTKTDRSGRFELVGLPAGEMSLCIDHPSWSFTIDGPFVVPEGGARLQREIEIDEGLEVTGTLLDPEGNPLRGETVELIALETAGERYRRSSVLTGEGGAFRFEHLVRGMYHVRWVERRGELTCYRITRMLELEDDDTPEIRLQATGQASLHGTLHYEGDLPELVAVTATRRGDYAGGATHHWARFQDGVFAEDGSFELAALETGRYTVSCWITAADGRPFARGSATVEVPPTGAVDVALEIQRYHH